MEVGAPHIGADWRQDNGELYLAGEWLTQSGQTGQPIKITGKIFLGSSRILFMAVF
ncbi:SymE family type I addiction module toxin [Yersinia aldovae]|uniref:SymE family type I addiction module toxin n=1 Tax=Yersinia aldovae TaxID=29483 RepID=UPI001643A75C